MEVTTGLSFTVLATSDAAPSSESCASEAGIFMVFRVSVRGRGRAYSGTPPRPACGGPGGAVGPIGRGPRSGRVREAQQARLQGRLGRGRRQRRRAPLVDRVALGPRV